MNAAALNAAIERVATRPGCWVMRASPVLEEFVDLGAQMDHLAGKVFVDYLSPLKRQMVARKLDKRRRQQA